MWDLPVLGHGASSTQALLQLNKFLWKHLLLNWRNLHIKFGLAVSRACPLRRGHVRLKAVLAYLQIPLKDELQFRLTLHPGNNCEQTFQSSGSDTLTQPVQLPSDKAHQTLPSFHNFFADIISRFYYSLLFYQGFLFTSSEVRQTQLSQFKLAQNNPKAAGKGLICSLFIPVLQWPFQVSLGISTCCMYRKHTCTHMF